MKNHLFFDYKSTSRIRIKKCNCYQHDSYPYIYKIITKRLHFVIPKSMTIFTKEYVYIPLEYYRRILSDFYIKISYHESRN